MQTSTKWGIISPVLARTDRADVPADVNAIITALESIGAMYAQGTTVGRPAFGKAGRFYVATDVTPAALSFDTGAAWLSLGQIAAGAVGTTELANLAVTAAKIADLTITAAKIADGAINSAKISDGTIATADIADSAVTSVKIADATITGTDIAADTIAAGNIAPNAIGTSELADASVDTAAIIDGAVTTAKIPDGAISTAKLADQSVTSAKLLQGFGTSFPVTGLFNGYRFTLFSKGVSPGDATAPFIGQDFMYRADLDATYPWHFIGGPSHKSFGSGMILARAGQWDIEYLADYIVGGTSPIHGIDTLTTTSGTFQGVSVVNVAMNDTVVEVMASASVRLSGASAGAAISKTSSGGGGASTFTFEARPVKLA